MARPGLLVACSVGRLVVDERIARIDRAIVQGQPDGALLGGQRLDGGAEGSVAAQGQPDPQRGVRRFTGGCGELFLGEGVIEQETEVPG